MTKRSGRRAARKRTRPSNPTGGRLVSGPQMEYQARTAENVAALRFNKAMRGPNHKYINSVYNGLFSSTLTTSAPYIVCLNAIALGTSENARIGRLTKNRWLDIDLDVFTSNSGSSQWYSLGVRIFILAECTALGSAPSASQFFLDSSTFTPTSQRDRTNRNASRFIVLWDSRPFVLGENPNASGFVYPSNTGVAPIEKFFSFHLPLEFSTDYSRGTAGTYADIETNALTLLVVTDHNTSGDVIIQGGYTLCFDDDS